MRMRRLHGGWAFTTRLRVAAMAVATLVAGGCFGGSQGAKAELEAKVTLEAGAMDVRLDAEAREIVFEMQPVDMPARADHFSAEQPPAHLGTFPAAGWIHGYTAELVDDRGNEVPRELLHHVNLIAPDQRELFSPIMRRLGAAGTETAPVRLPRLLGYPIEEGERLLVTAMVHNPTGTSYDGVRVRIRMPYTPKSAWIDPIEVYPFYMDVMPPAGTHAYDLPPGRSEKSWEGSPAVSGRILGMGGHLHDNAVALRLEDRTTGELVWETRPEFDEDGRVVGMPQGKFWWKLGIPIRSDHTYSLTAIYDNPGDTIPAGAMGALGGIITAGRDERWPAPNPDHPDYEKDVAVTTAGGAYGHEHGGMMMGDMQMDGTDDTSSEEVGASHDQEPAHQH